MVRGKFCSGLSPESRWFPLQNFPTKPIHWYYLLSRIFHDVNHAKYWAIPMYRSTHISQWQPLTTRSAIIRSSSWAEVAAARPPCCAMRRLTRQRGKRDRGDFFRAPQTTCGGFLKWMVFVRDNPNQKWMMGGGTRILGNFHVSYCVQLQELDLGMY